MSKMCVSNLHAMFHRQNLFFCFTPSHKGKNLFRFEQELEEKRLLEGVRGC